MNKKALITGASSGIGMSTARYFARAGYDLVLTARRIEKLVELKTKLNEQYPNISIEIIELDVREKIK